MSVRYRDDHDGAILGGPLERVFPFQRTEVLIWISPEGASNFGTKCSESTCNQVVLLAMLAQWDTQF